jgi:serine/threonine protein kinase
MEYAPHGDLQDCVKQPLPEAEARTIIQQMVEALEILHSKNWAHRDLKPSVSGSRGRCSGADLVQNVFVIQKGPSWWVKLGDLGVSKRVADEMTRYRTSIETDFTAPEVLGFVGAGPEEASSYTNAVDIWSLGCLMHWLLTLKLPLTRRQMNAFCIDALDLPLQHLMERHVTDGGIDFVLSLLQPHPEQRPTANRIIGHKWLYAIADFSSFPKSGLGVRLDTQPNCIPGQKGTVGALAAGLPNIKALQIQPMPQDHREDNTTIKTPSASVRGHYDITRDEKKAYDELFRAWDKFSKGHIPENIAFTIMRQSNLEQRDLEAIWKLADGNKRGRLGIDEFAVAMHLVYKKLNGYPVPAHLPSEPMRTSKMGFNSFNGTVQDPHQKPLAQHSPHEVRSLQGSPYDPRYIKSELPGHYEPQISGQSDGARLDILRDDPVYHY